MKESDIRWLGLRISGSVGQELIDFALKSTEGYPPGTDVVVQAERLGSGYAVRVFVKRPQDPGHFAIFDTLGKPYVPRG